MHTDFRKRQPWCWYELGLNGSFQLKISIHRPAYERLLGGLEGTAMPPLLHPAHTKYGHMVAFAAALPSPGDVEGEAELCHQLATVFHGLRGMGGVFPDQNLRQKRQLLEITLLAPGTGDHDSGIHCQVYPQLGRWLLGDGRLDQEFPKVHRTLLKIQRRLWLGASDSMKRAIEEDTRCRLMHGYLYVRIFGQSSDLAPESISGGYAGDIDYELVPHNIDGPAQILTLLWGLARIHDLARGA